MPEGISLSPQEMGIPIPPPEKSPQTPELSSPLEKASSGYLDQQHTALWSKLKGQVDTARALGLTLGLVSAAFGSLGGMQKLGAPAEMSMNITAGAMLSLGFLVMKKVMKKSETKTGNEPN